MFLNKVKNQKRFFDLFSESYSLIELLTLGFANRIRKRSLLILNPLKDNIVCDLMCGNGQNIGILRKYFHCKKIIGVDVSIRMIGCAKNRFGEENILYFTENVLASSVPSNYCDAVCCTFGLKTLLPEQRNLLILEVYRILKPSGTFVFAELSEPVGFVYIFWKLYFVYFLPLIGKLFSYPFVKNKYLANSISIFGNIFSDESSFRSVFSKVNLFSWYGGIVTGVFGQKL
ncbi:class I SAM-dependent methyltransferase [Leptospira noguchii]|uniref:Methyltransferase, UbiE/COQ5 family n=2 Tax=Leptospira noguchii TaxID=28182 RepID=M6UJE4_9LEPT|nr:class I SAM-dependent methyltransferase [Leptospira noguchii]EKR71901.1 methyltransferase, UbiE/COQ5 family [Leptospira noguchii str. 2006001870]EMO41184.1 methyltransferase, UbiE/COQ5 family [Leptospira noguchii serovar Autumnalis str. ZUN142]EMS83112.1 methyltransferase, UbiE/COQ5 family [Leptospira noguchii str. Hook]TQE72367.1 methyltransferase domain-containing protein [Leptospira noguchii]UOG31101.1 class I SAM-dependent methyltransferase [Leptospira noguchii]